MSSKKRNLHLNIFAIFRCKKKIVGKYFCVGNLSEKPKRGERRIRMVNIGKIQQRRKKSKIIIFFLVEPDFLIYGTAYFQ